MKTRKVKLEIERLGVISAKIEKTLVVEACQNSRDTLRSAELIWLNEYIGRNTNRKVYNVTEGKKIAKVKIKSLFID